MSNILIIKHGFLGDIIQANGAIKDIKNFHKIEKFFTYNQAICNFYVRMPLLGRRYNR